MLRSARFVMLVLSGLALVLLTGCSGAPRPSSSGLSREPDPALERVYRVGIGDRLKIVVFGEPDLSGEFEVGAGGAISMPLLGDLPAKGQTVQQLSSSLTQRLDDGYLKDPKVSIQVLNYRSFFVHGEVKGGGELTFKNGLTIGDAIAMAGGYSYRADQTFVYLRREGGAEAEAIALDAPIPVLPGDNIQVPERFF